MVDQIDPPIERTHAGPPMPRVDLTPPGMSIDAIVSGQYGDYGAGYSGSYEEFEQQFETPQHSLKHKAFWTFVDQGLSSATNAALVFLVAGTVSKEAFGSFSLALTAFSFAVGISRAAVSDPLVIRFSAQGGKKLHDATKQAIGTAFVLGLIASLACVVASLLVHQDSLRFVLLALATVLPGLVAQDSWRQAFFSAGRPAAAAANDAIWGVVQFALIGGLILTGGNSVVFLTLAWGIAACVAAFAGILQSKAVPNPFAAIAWFKAHGELSIRTGADYVINMGSVNVGTFLISGIAGTVAVGTLRAAQTLLGPLLLAVYGMSAFVLPVMTKKVDAGEKIRKQVLLVSSALTVVALMGTGVLAVLPNAIGQLVLGDTWNGARAVIVVAGLTLAATCSAIGPSLGLKAYSQVGLLLGVTCVQGPLLLGLGCLGASQGGAFGAQCGFLIAQCVGTVLGWILFGVAERRGVMQNAPVFARHARTYDRWAWAVGPSTPRHGPTTRGVVVPTRPAQAAGRHVLRRAPKQVAQRR